MVLWLPISSATVRIIHFPLRGLDGDHDSPFFPCSCYTILRRIYLEGNCGGWSSSPPEITEILRAKLFFEITSKRWPHEGLKSLFDVGPRQGEKFVKPTLQEVLEGSENVDRKDPAKGFPAETLFGISRFLRNAHSGVNYPMVWKCHSSDSQETVRLPEEVVDAYGPEALESNFF